MSDREYRRAEVLARVLKRDLKLVDAAVLLDVSYRQSQRLLQRMRERGRKGLVSIAGAATLVSPKQSPDAAL